MNILTIKNLRKEFHIHHQERHLVSCDNINLQVPTGAFIGITGKSGAGKSTILKCIHRTFLPTSGSVIYDSEAFGEIDLAVATERQILHLRTHEIGYVSQFLNVMPRTTAKEHVISALRPTCNSEQEAKVKASEMLDYFCLSEELWDIFPGTFSGGERLRLNLAHTMVRSTRLLLLDEPTASLDADSKTLVANILHKLKGSASMIGIFHDIEFMEDICDTVYRVKDGSIHVAA